MITFSAPVRLAFLGSHVPTQGGANHTLASAVQAAMARPVKQRIGAIIYFDDAAGLPYSSPLSLADINELYARPDFPKE